jgi:Aminotransferase class-III
MTSIPNASNLFYQNRLRRPMLDRADGVYLWDTTGKRYFDGSSGAMVSNIGHSNSVVLEAMKRQMDKATFGYRLHFENEPAEKFATAIAQRMPEGLGGKRHQDRPPVCSCKRRSVALEGHLALSVIPWVNARRACGHRHEPDERTVFADDDRDAQNPGSDLLSRP